MADFGDTLAQIQREDELLALRRAAKQLRDFLAGALCCHCGEELGHEEIISDDEDRTIHKRCEKAETED